MASFGGCGGDLPYGSWPSPFTAKFITSSSVGLSNVKCDGDGGLWWQESRPQEGGRNVVVRRDAGAAGASERGAVDVTPPDKNVRTRVHEYGGGAFCLGPGGAVVFSDFGTQRLHATEGGATRVVTAGDPEGRYRYADYAVDPSGAFVVGVREDHGPAGDRKPSEVVNEVVKVALEDGAATVLATGRDFYGAPRLSPDGSRVAYVTWDHPNMPWDATELRLAAVDGAAPATEGHDLVDGADGDTSVLQCAWHPETAELYYVSDAPGNYVLKKFDGTSSSTVLDVGVDLGGSAPGWVFGQQGYSFLPDGAVAAAYPDRATGRTVLHVVAPDGSSAVYDKDDGLPHAFGGVAPAPDGSLYLLGGGPDTPSGIFHWDPATKVGKKLASSSSAEVPEGYVSVPKPVEFPCPLGTAHAYYYAPANKDCSSSEAAPPLLVKAHGGPTACTGPNYNPGIQFFTSRGFAVLDVDYGGSTGYGREYRRRLRGSWGVVDIDDVCAGATYLVDQGLADAKRLAIDGGSAGGFTTLGALAFKDVFTAGCSLYGVADLAALAGDTHKFESRYLDSLVGAYPADEAVYAARAPINAVDKLNCPILLLQGDEDKIVPLNQAQLMHEALLAKNIPCKLKVYEGEQHGFRKAENIEDALNSELYFYSKVFGFACAGDDITPFAIDNMA
ncbi:serine-type peptidase [Aureococcus anophagefferens]|nr:serine-type peptidase [Aureococcus anophagefferens]